MPRPEYPDAPVVHGASGDDPQPDQAWFVAAPMPEGFWDDPGWVGDTTATVPSTNGHHGTPVPPAPVGQADPDDDLDVHFEGSLFDLFDDTGDDG